MYFYFPQKYSNLLKRISNIEIILIRKENDTRRARVRACARVPGYMELKLRVYNH